MAENERQLQAMQRKLREEELRVLRGQAKVGLNKCLAFDVFP